MATKQMEAEMAATNNASYSRVVSVQTWGWVRICTHAQKAFLASWEWIHKTHNLHREHDFCSNFLHIFNTTTEIFRLTLKGPKLGPIYY
jgi:hypothetical protein